MISLKVVILKKFEFTQLDYFSNQLHSPEVSLRNQLPYKLENKESSKRKALAFSFEFESLKNDYRPSIMLHPITGNLNKEGTLLSTNKIEEIEVDTFLFKKEKFSTEEKELVEASFYLSDNYLDIINSSTFLTSNYIHNKLLKLVPELQNKIIYGITENNYKISKQYLEPILVSIKSADLEFKITEDKIFIALKHTLLSIIESRN